MSSKQKATSSVRADDAHGKSIDKLSVKEFRDRFCIPNGVIVEFLNGEDVVSTEKAEQDTVIFSKEQFNAGLRFPLPALFKEFLHFTQIPPVFIHPNIHVRAPALPSTGDGTARLDEGGAKGHVAVRGAWAGSSGCPGEALLSKLLLSDSGPGKKGPLVDWVEKASFAVSSMSSTLPRKMPKEVVPGEHYTVKDLSIYQEFKEADAEKRRALLDNREKKKNEGTLRKAPG
ncbi:hypothetical protein CK203_060616 [Vitis vinifera]|uniref:Uncharacterized protein n=1 Tax=Vitis vinifera TaxID=29760 RepID=A0A438GC18_VITVI|nr:hypothetical protein CK203_060616 [Vitis vinifera]